MQEKPLVSILMTAYNRQDYIKEAIESVLVSTYQNFELLIVDDCSIDKTVEIAKTFEAKDKRVKVILNEKNLGDYPNRNKAASLAAGKYIKYVDSDDIIYPHCLEIMVDAMEKFPEAGFGFDFYNYKHEFPLPKLLQPEESFQKHFFNGGLLFIGPLGSIYRTVFFNQINAFDPEFSVSSDYEFNTRGAESSPVVLFQRDLYWYRQHPEQEKNVRQDEYIYLNFKINQKALFSPTCPLNNHAKKLALRNNLTLCSRKIVILLFSFKFTKAYYLWQTTGITFFKLFSAFHPAGIRKYLPYKIN